MQPLLNLFKEFALNKGIADDTYIVGGAVRDMLSGIETKDIDLSTKGDAVEISKEFAQVSGSTFVLLDSKFGIARVVKDSIFLDISAMRGDSITSDLADRDITINAMARPLCEWRSTVNIIDPFGGQEDLKSGTIRMVSEKNLISDPLRILRVYRFSAALHAAIELNTRLALKKHGDLIKDVALERIAEELRYIMALPDSDEVMHKIEEDNIIAVLFPEFSAHDIDIKRGIACYGHCELMLADPARYFPLHQKHVFDYFKLPARRICLKLAALFSGEALVQKAALRLRMSNKESELVAAISSGHKNIVSLCNTGAGKSELVRFLKVTKDDLYPIAMLTMAVREVYNQHSADRIVASEYKVLTFCNSLLSLYIDEVMPRMSLLKMINGDDLIREFGLSPSPQFKRILAGLEDDILEGKVNTRDEALSAVSDILSRGL